MFGKRYIPVFILGVILAALCACGMQKQPISNIDAPPVSGVSADITPTPEAPATQIPVEISSQPEETPAVQAKTNLKRGAWNDGVYINEFSGLKFTLPEGWAALTDEEMEKAFNISADVFSSEENWLKEVAKEAAFYDQVAIERSIGSSIGFCYQIVSYDDKLSRNLVENQYYDNLKDSLSRSKYNFTIGDNRMVMFDNGIYRCIDARDDNAGISTRTYFKYQEDVMISLVISLSDKSKITMDEIASQFETDF